MAELTNDEADDLADEILSGEQFITETEPGPVQRALNRVLEFIGDVLSSIFGGIGGIGGGAGQIIAIVLLVAAIGLLGFAIYRAVTNRAPSEEETGESDARVVFDELVEPDELEALLLQYRQQSNWRAAVVAGFRLSVLSIIDRGIAREVAGATTGYFAAAVNERRPELSATFAPAAESFDRAFYSDLAIGPEDLAKVDALLRQLELVGSR